MPSQNGYSVNPNGLLETSAELESVNNALKAVEEELNAAVTAFCNANQGENVDAYRTAQSHWNAGFAEMNAALNDAKHALNSINERYVRTDKSGAAVFGV